MDRLRELSTRKKAPIVLFYVHLKLRQISCHHQAKRMNCLVIEKDSIFSQTDLRSARSIWAIEFCKTEHETPIRNGIRE
jgi:transposase